jgi:hypothetical protein
VPLSELRSGSSPALGVSTPLAPLLAWWGGAVQQGVLASSRAALMFCLSSAMMRVSAISPPADAFALLGAGAGLGDQSVRSTRIRKLQPSGCSTTRCRAPQLQIRPNTGSERPYSG